MSINTPVPPDIRAAFESGLASFLGRSGDDRRSAELLRSSVGMPVYTVGLGHFNDERLDPRLSPCGWMFLTGAAPDPVLVTEVYEPGRGAEPRVVNVSCEPENQKIRRIAEGLETLPDTRAADYDMRVLRIPALGVEAFWLKAEEPDQDQVVPFLSLDREVRMGHPYPTTEFLKEMCKLRERTHFPSHPGPVHRDGTDTPSATSS